MRRDALQVLAGTLLGVPGPAAASCAAVAVWSSTPELPVDTSMRPAIAHVDRMAECPSDIRSIEVAPADPDAPVRKIVLKGDFFRVRSVPLAVGDNPVGVRLARGQVRAVVRATGLCRSRRFVLQAQ